MDEQSTELFNFFSGFKKISFKKGQTIYRAEDEIHGVSYLKKGYVRLYALSKNAQELTLIIYRPGDPFPLIPSINKTLPAYYTEAMTPVELYQAPLAEFRNFIKNNNNVLSELNNLILTRFGGVLTRMEYAIFGNAASKVAAIILICAERFGRNTKQGTIIQVPLTHQDIANLLGVARETVSIEMKKLQRKNLIGYQRKYLIIINMQKLKEESVLESDY